jgi:hypothetical protein
MWHPGVSSRAYERQTSRVLARMAKATFLDREI